MSTFSNAIVVVGNTGVGKSHICNLIFQYCGSSNLFVSSASTHSVTRALQTGRITYNGKSYTLIDNPGFFDTPESGDSNDGPNLCNLVKALESCKEIVSLVFVYTDRFSTPHKIWFDRMKEMLTETYRGHIVLLHNKLGPLNDHARVENKFNIGEMMNYLHDYIWFSYNADMDQVETTLKTITKFSPFQLSGLTDRIPKICYDRTEDGQPYEEEIARNVADEGHMATQVKDNSHYETRREYDGLVGRILGQKSTHQVWVPSTAEVKVWIQKTVTTRTLVTYVDTYNIRFDGTRDFKSKREISRREEKL